MKQKQMKSITQYFKTRKFLNDRIQKEHKPKNSSDLEKRFEVTELREEYVI